MENRDLIIIGSGSAGWTASIYAKRGGLNPLVLTGSEVGGQLTRTTIVENYSGFPNGIDGMELMDNMQKQASNLGVEHRIESVLNIDFDSYPYTVTSDSNTYTAKSIIIATGASHRYLGVDGEKTYADKGVHYCATCDGFFYSDKEVVVIGGGDTACEDALYLSNICSKVTMLVRGDKMRASQTMQDRVKNNPNITVLYNHPTLDIIGTVNGVNGVKTPNTTIHCDGVFVAVGIVPNTSFLSTALNMDSDGYIITENTKTNLKGVFACGDVQDKIYRQAIVSAGTGCMAGMEAINFLNN